MLLIIYGAFMSMSGDNVYDKSKLQSVDRLKKKWVSLRLYKAESGLKWYTLDILYRFSQTFHNAMCLKYNMRFLVPLMPWGDAWKYSSKIYEKEFAEKIVFSSSATVRKTISRLALS